MTAPTKTGEATADPGEREGDEVSGVKTDTREISGHEVEVFAITSPGNSYSDGRWSVCLKSKDGTTGEEIGRAESLDKAISQARTKLAKKKVKVEVPFRLRSGKRGVATGIHGGTGNVTARIEQWSGRMDPEQLQARDQVFKAETPDSVFDRLNAIRDETNRLHDEQREIENEWNLNSYGIKSEVEDAVDAAAEKAIEGEGVEA